MDDLARLLRGRRWAALTGAGLSTDSGIPDYRGAGSRPTSPIQYDAFVRSADVRRRYWARSMIGFRSFGVALPNPGHRALAELRRCGLTTIITQNVDGLHQAAGSTDVIDLHGRIDRVTCLTCGADSSRFALQQRLEAANPQVSGDVAAGRAELDDAELRPDGDAVVEHWADFVVLPCAACGGVLKPDVVFFGESVPPAVVAHSYAAVDEADALLVAGSSLTVMSGLRFVRHAAKQGKPVAIVNRGVTRGDDLAGVKVDAGTSETLTGLLAALVPYSEPQHSARTGGGP